MFSSCSLAVLDPRVGHTMDILSPFISVFCHSDGLFHQIYVYILMLSIWGCVFLVGPDLSDDMRAGANLRPCVVFLTCVHLALLLALSVCPCFLMVWPHASLLALTVSNSCPFTPALLRTHSCFLCCTQNPQNLSLSYHLSVLSESFVSS